MNWVTLITGILLTVHVVVSLFLILIILMQRPRSEGLGTAFGSAVTDTLFGSGAGNVLTKITTWFSVVFFATTLCLAYIYSHNRPTSSVLGEQLKATDENLIPPQVLPLTNSFPPIVPLEASPAGLQTNVGTEKRPSPATAVSTNTTNSAKKSESPLGKATDPGKKKAKSSTKS
jgi:preprotein translocase subunit SecG